MQLPRSRRIDPPAARSEDEHEWGDMGTPHMPPKPLGSFRGQSCCRRFALVRRECARRRDQSRSESSRRAIRRALTNPRFYTSSGHYSTSQTPGGYRPSQIERPAEPHCAHPPYPRRRHAGTGRSRRGPVRRLQARRLAAPLCRPGHGRHRGSGTTGDSCESPYTGIFLQMRRIQGVDRDRCRERTDELDSEAP